jgi:hypothetical protein
MKRAIEELATPIGIAIVALSLSTAFYIMAKATVLLWGARL